MVEEIDIGTATMSAKRLPHIVISIIYDHILSRLVDIDSVSGNCFYRARTVFALAVVGIIIRP